MPDVQLPGRDSAPDRPGRTLRAFAGWRRLSPLNANHIGDELDATVERRDATMHDGSARAGIRAAASALSRRNAVMRWLRLGRGVVAGAFALVLPVYAVSADDSGHAELQVILLFGSATLVYETLVELLDRAGADERDCLS